MLEQLGRVAREARLAAERSQLDIATTARMSGAVVSRFETGRIWPRDVERLVWAYEKECALLRGELWRRAARTL